MTNINKVFLAGNLTRDVVVRKTKGGLKVGDFGLAINRKKKDGTEEVCFLDVTVWGDQADLCEQYLAKGKPALVEGYIRYETWESEGQKKSKHKVVASKVEFLSAPKRQEQIEYQLEEDSDNQADIEEDVPF